MDDIALINSSGSEQVDNLLRGFVGLCELSLPGRIRGYYLTGSWSNGTALYIPGDRDRSSDIDVRVIFKGSLEEQDRCQFEALLTGYCRLSPLTLEVYPADETALARNWDICLKQESLLLYGEDIRASLPLPSLEDHIQRVMTFPPYALAAVRGQVLYADGQWQEPWLKHPLAYPDPDGEFYGYNIGSSLGGLVGDATWAATVILAVKAGLYAGTKRTAAFLYRERIDDEWHDLPAAIFERCKLAWGLQVPAAPADRRQLREMCRRTLGLENYLLELYRDYLGETLQSPDPENVRYALRMLAMIVYDDAPILSALRRLASSDDVELSGAVQRTLGRMERGS
jgi:hypothetical protein